MDCTWKNETLSNFFEKFARQAFTLSSHADDPGYEQHTTDFPSPQSISHQRVDRHRAYYDDKRCKSWKLVMTLPENLWKWNQSAMACWQNKFCDFSAQSRAEWEQVGVWTWSSTSSACAVSCATLPAVQWKSIYHMYTYLNMQIASKNPPYKIPDLMSPLSILWGGERVPEITSVFSGFVSVQTTQMYVAHTFVCLPWLCRALRFQLCPSHLKNTDDPQTRQKLPKRAAIQLAVPNFICLRPKG